jgi:hypothetical protein
MELKTLSLRKIFLLITGSFLLLSGCSESNLPEEHPKDVVIIYKEDGGMLDVGKTIYLSKDSNYVIFRNYGTDNKIYLMFGDSDLDRLYDVFRENNFPNIGVRTEEGVGDRGGSSVSISFGGKTISKSNSGTFFVENSSEKLYLNVTDAINKLVDDFLELMKRNFKIELDTTLIGENRTLQFNINSDYSYNSEKEGRRESILLSILDGPNVFSLTMNEKNTSSGKLEQKAKKQIPITIDPLMAGARFYYEDNEIKWAPQNININ